MMTFDLGTAFAGSDREPTAQDTALAQIEHQDTPQDVIDAFEETVIRELNQGNRSIEPAAQTMDEAETDTSVHVEINPEIHNEYMSLLRETAERAYDLHTTDMTPEERNNWIMEEEHPILTETAVRFAAITRLVAGRSHPEGEINARNDEREYILGRADLSHLGLVMNGLSFNDAFFEATDTPEGEVMGLAMDITNGEVLEGDSLDRLLGLLEGERELGEATNIGSLLLMLNFNQAEALVKHFVDQLGEKPVEELAAHIGYIISLSPLIAGNLVKILNENAGDQALEGELMALVNIHVMEGREEMLRMTEALENVSENVEVENMLTNNYRILGAGLMIYGSIMAIFNFALGVANPKHFVPAAAYGAGGLLLAATGTSLVTGNEGLHWTRTLFNRIAYSEEELEAHGQHAVIQQLREIMDVDFRYVDELFATDDFIEEIRGFQRGGPFTYEEFDHSLANRVNNGEASPRVLALLRSYRMALGGSERAEAALNFLAPSYSLFNVRDRGGFIERIAGRMQLPASVFSGESTPNLTV